MSSAIEDCWNSCELCDVHTYFAKLKEEFSQPADNKKSKSLSRREMCKERACSQSKENFSFDHSPKNARNSITEADDFLQSKQKSLELNKSRLNRRERCASTGGLSFDGKHVSSRWYLRNDDATNNNVVDDDLTELQSNHRERALNQGRLYSVAEQNRKQRKKYYGRLERKLSREGTNLVQPSPETA